MIISDLNHLEAVSETVEVTGGTTSLIQFFFPENAILTSLSETSQTKNGTTINSAAGTLKTAEGTNIAFAATVSSPAQP
ncbi:MAG: hypothetical protein ACFBSE_08640 [Prochloraceae cyanobacterium]